VHDAWRNSRRVLRDGGRGRTRTYEGVSQRIYSPPPLPLGTLSRTSCFRYRSDVRNGDGPSTRQRRSGLFICRPDAVSTGPAAGPRACPSAQPGRSRPGRQRRRLAGRAVADSAHRGKIKHRAEDGADQPAPAAHIDDDAIGTKQGQPDRHRAGEREPPQAPCRSSRRDNAADLTATSCKGLRGGPAGVSPGNSRRR
jgi:hypothetical protein